MGSSMPTFTSDWFSTHIPSWTYIFNRTKWDTNKPNVVIEIGAYEGRSSLWIMQNLLHHPQSRLFCIDLFPDHEQEGSYWHRFKGNVLDPLVGTDDERTHAYIGPSSDFLVEFIQGKGKADFIYIDGSHRASDVLLDLTLAFKALALGGLVICDDYLGGSQRDIVLDTPKIAIDAFTNIYRDQIEIISGVPLYQLAFRKIIDRSHDDPSSRGIAA